MSATTHPETQRTRGTRDPDVETARLLIRMREERGIARDRLPYEMRQAGIVIGRIPSPKTLYRIEELGREPSIGIKAALAEFFGFDLHDVWPPREPRCARGAIQ